jgi:bile acid:Na+ symporter, BASS family
MDKLLEKTSDVVQNQLLWFLLAFSALAVFWPGDRVDPFLFTKPALSIMLAVTMFCIGCLLPREEVDQLFRRWPTVLGGTAIQYASMPLLAYLIGRGFGLEGAYLTGITFVGCVPGAMASNVITLAAKGNVSYSVSLTTSATILSPFVVPFVLSLTLDVDSREKFAPVAVMTKLLWTVVGPVIGGHLLCRSFDAVSRVMKPVGALAANSTIIWIIAVVVAMNRDGLRSVDGSGAAVLMIGALITLNVSGYVSGYFGGKAMQIGPDMRRALSLEVGMQNAGLGTILVLDMFPDQPGAAIPTALYTFGCMFSGIAAPG